jgi:chromosomal replication initiation ATPase DnaA
MNPYIFPGLETKAICNYSEDNNIKNMAIDTILAIVSDYLHISGNRVRCFNENVQKQSSIYPYAKQLVSYFARKERYTYYAIRDYFGYKNHKSVFHNFHIIEDLLDVDVRVANDVKIIQKNINNKIKL